MSVLTRLERLQHAIAEGQFQAAVRDWHEAWHELESPIKARLAARVTHWKRVLEVLGGL